MGCSNYPYHRIPTTTPARRPILQAKPFGMRKTTLPPMPSAGWIFRFGGSSVWDSLGHFHVFTNYYSVTIILLFHLSYENAFSISPINWQAVDSDKSIDILFGCQSIPLFSIERPLISKKMSGRAWVIVETLRFRAVGAVWTTPARHPLQALKPFVSKKSRDFLKKVVSYDYFPSLPVQSAWFWGLYHPNSLRFFQSIKLIRIPLHLLHNPPDVDFPRREVGTTVSFPNRSPKAVQPTDKPFFVNKCSR